MADFLSATNAVINQAKSVVSTSVASAVTKVKETIAGFDLGHVGLSKVNLPIPNPLHNYVTYTYVLSLGVISVDDASDPDAPYMQGKPVPLICKSANADPNNRVTTAYGKFDFYIDNVVMDGAIGLMKSTTNVSLISFDITEPYSMGVFMQALQTAAYQAGWPNFQGACYLLTIEFRGNADAGSLGVIPNSTMRIPIKITTVNSSVNESGTVYNVQAFNWGAQALANKHSALRSYTSISGKTVQEILQTGEKSLQYVLNYQLQEQQRYTGVSKPDQIVILFPSTTESLSASSVPGSKETKTSATVSSSSQPNQQPNLYTKLGVTEQGPLRLLVQTPELCNEIGRASMGFDTTRPGDAPFGKDNEVYSVELSSVVRAKNTANTSTSDFRFAQKQDIVSVIENVILQSDFYNKQFNNKLPPDGFRTWFRIETQTYVLKNPENVSVTGDYPRLYVYRVVPYRVHASRFTSVNTAAPGLDLINSQVVKEFNYLYTGKNTDVLRFDMNLSVGFQQVLAADNFQANQDVVRSKSTADSVDKNDKQKTEVAKGKSIIPTVIQNITNSIVYAAQEATTDRQGGGGTETVATRAARMFHDILLYGYDKQLLNMDIVGDPYFITQSGLGNYSAKPTSNPFINSDGTIAWQNGEALIRINFRTPVDINQASGMYSFGPGTASAPVSMFSGLYSVTTIVSRFKDGNFTQTITGFRLQNQDTSKLGVGTTTQTFGGNNK